MTLGPRTLKAIAEGPQDQPVHQTIPSPDGGAPIGHVYFHSESARDFARRVALLAVEEERERAILEHDQSACAAEIADLKKRLEVAHAEGFADGARAQRAMEPTDEMLEASIAGLSFPQDYSLYCQGLAIARHDEIFRAMQRAAPLAGDPAVREEG